MTYAGVKGRGTGGSASAFAQVFNFLGTYQPYGVYVPDAPGPYGLQMEWHGSNQGIVAQINQPGMQADFGDELNRVLVTPLARGPNGYGSDVSERDLLDVMADAEQTFPVDLERVFSSGYSQGGYITFRMAMLHPDRFAGFTGWVPFTGNDTNGTPVEGEVDVTAGAVGNMIHYTRNTRHVPGSMIFGSADELVQVPSATAMEQSFAATDTPYVWFMHTPADHFTFAAADVWQKEADYSQGPAAGAQPAAGDLPHRRAAVGRRSSTSGTTRPTGSAQLRGREEGFVDTDLTTHGCGGEVPVLEQSTGAGPGPLPAPWVSRVEGRRRHRAAAGRAEAASARCVNVASLRARPAGDVPAQRGGVRHHERRPGGHRAPGRPDDRARRGQNTGTIGGAAAPAPGTAAPGRLRRAPPHPAPDRRALPATGAPALVPLAAAGALVLAGALRRRRQGEENLAARRGRARPTRL